MPRLAVTARLGGSFGPLLVASPLGQGLPPPCRTPPHASRRRNAPGTGIFSGFPSATPPGLALGADLPRADCPCAGNLRFSADGDRTRLIVTHACILSSASSRGPRGSPFAGQRNAPLPGAPDARPPGFGAALSPATLSARGCSTSELLRTLSRDGCVWANLLAVCASPPPSTLSAASGPWPRVRAVSLSTANLVARGLTPAGRPAAFGV